VSDTQRFDLLLTDGRAKSAADLPITEAAKLRNDGVKQDLLSLRAQQIALSDEVEGLKRERSAIMEQVVRSLHSYRHKARQLILLDDQETRDRHLNPAIQCCPVTSSSIT
jgi:hypothetical protein